MIDYIILISNLLVTLGLFFATLYRIKIEKMQTDVMVKNARAAERIRTLKRLIETEKEIIISMSGKELIEFLEKICDED